MIHAHPRNPDSKFTKFILSQDPEGKRCHKNPQILCLFLLQKNPIPQPEKTLFIVFVEPSPVLRPGSSQYQNVCMCLFEQFSFAQIEK